MEGLIVASKVAAISQMLVEVDFKKLRDATVMDADLRRAIDTLVAEKAAGADLDQSGGR